MIVTLNGVTVFSHTSDTANYLLSYADPNEVLNFEFGLTHNLLHLPIPQMLEHGPIEPNVLKWPACASRFATLFLLIDDTDMALLRSKFGLTGPVATTLFLDGEDEDDDLTISMYMLPPRPLAPLAMTGENGLWLLPLVDKRYFWWFKSADITTLTSWANLISAVATALGVSITVSSVDADYGTPTTRFQTYRQPLPLLLDAIAYTIGMRFAAKIDGTYLIQNYADAKTAQDVEVALVSTNANMSGGAFRIGEAKRSVPDTVAVVFPKTLDGAVQLASYTKTVTLASLALTEYIGNGNVSGATNATPIVITTSAAHGLGTGDLVTIASVGGNTAANGVWAITVLTTTTFKLDMSVGNAAYTSGGTWTNVIVGFDGEKTIMGDLVATFTTAGGGTPTNDTALTNYTAQAATDWYKWEIYDSDYHFGGIVDWTINGQIDEVVWRFYADRATTRVSSGPYNDIAWGIHHGLDTTGSGGSSFTAHDQSIGVSTTTELIFPDQSVAQSGTAITVDVASATRVGFVDLSSSQVMGDGDKIFQDDVVVGKDLTVNMDELVSSTALWVKSNTGDNSFLVGVAGDATNIIASQESDTSGTLGTFYMYGVGDFYRYLAVNDGTFEGGLLAVNPRVRLFCGEAHSAGAPPFGGSVTNATNATPIVITTSAAHNLTTGDSITITGVLGNTAANGVWTITVVDADEFSLNTSVGNGAYTSGGLWSSFYRASGIHILGGPNAPNSFDNWILFDAFHCRTIFTNDLTQFPAVGSKLSVMDSTGAIQDGGTGNGAAGDVFYGGIWISAGSGLSPGDISGFDEAAQDAVGLMVDATLVYTDSTPELGRAAISGDVTINAGSNTATITDDPAQFYETGTWAPTFTNLTEVGGSATITGRFTRIGRTVYFVVTVIGVTTTAAVAGTTYCDLPIAAAFDDTCDTVDVTTSLGIGGGVVDATNDRCYPAGWAATGDLIVISGKYEV